MLSPRQPALVANGSANGVSPRTAKQLSTSLTEPLASDVMALSQFSLLKVRKKDEAKARAKARAKAKVKASVLLMAG